MNYAVCGKCGVVMPCRAHPVNSSAVERPDAALTGETP